MQRGWESSPSSFPESLRPRKQRRRADESSSSSSSSSTDIFALGKREYPQEWEAEPYNVYEGDQQGGHPGSVVGGLASFDKTEVKHLVGSFTAKCDLLSGPTLLNGIATGATNITRNGNVVKWLSFYCKGVLYQVDNTTAATRSDLYLVYDRQPGAALPANTDMFIVAAANSLPVFDAKSRFEVLAHRSFVLDQIDTTATQSYSGAHTAVCVDFFKKLNVVTNFKGTGNAIGDISTGALYMFYVGMGNVSYATGVVNYELTFIG